MALERKDGDFRMKDTIITRIKHYMSFRGLNRIELYNVVMEQLAQNNIKLKWGYKSWCFALQGSRNYNLVFVHQLNKIIKADESFMKYYEEVIDDE